MKTVRKSVIVARPAATMFQLVADCERYPQFLPWCAAAVVHDRTADSERASIDIDYHGLKTRVTTLNRLQFPGSIDLEFVEGPFRHFRGRWEFTPLGEDGSRVQFEVEYDFASGALESVLGPVFARIIETLVDRFVERAEGT